MKNSKKLLIIIILVLVTCAISIGAYFIENNKNKKVHEICTMERC